MQIKAKHPVKGVMTFASENIFNAIKRTEKDWEIVKEKKEVKKTVKDVVEDSTKKRSKIINHFKL